MKNSKLEFSELMQNISRSESFGKFVLIVMTSSRLWQHCALSSVDHSWEVSRSNNKKA